jgi:hypothetical protein
VVARPGVVPEAARRPVVGLSNAPTQRHMWRQLSHEGAEAADRCRGYEHGLADV